MIFPSHCLVYENRERGMCFPSLAFANRIKTLSGIKNKKSKRKQCVYEQLQKRMSLRINWLKDKRFMEYRNI